MLDSNIYSKKYFESERCEGFYEAKRGVLSPVKMKEMEMLRIKKNEIFLDVGCGRGDILAYANKLGCDIWGIDYSKDAISLSKKKVPKKNRHQIVKGNALNTGFSDNFFDKILVGDVVEHVTYEEAKEMVDELFRILKPKGKILIHTAPNLWFKKFIYPLLKVVLLLMNQNKLKISLERNIKATYKYHVDEYSIVGFNRLMKKSKFNDYKTWILRDALRTESRNYLTPLKKSAFLNIFVRLINGSFLIYFFGNDLFCLATKSSNCKKFES